MGGRTATWVICLVVLPWILVSLAAWAVWQLFS
jgi:hypothetical protein